MSVSPRPPTTFVPTPSWTASAPKSNSSQVIVAGADGKFRAYAEKSGAALWQSKALEETVDFRVSDQFVVSQDRRSLSSLSTQNGKLLWKRSHPGDLVALKDQVVLTNKFGELQAIDLESGEFRWKSPTHSPPTAVGDQVLLVTGQKDQIETLESRNAQTGQRLWSTTDGDIEHVISSENSVIYSSQKLGRHAQKIQIVSCRDHQGKGQWNHQSPGLLRQAPKFSPDGRKVCLTGRDPANGSKSFLTLLNAQTGETIFSTQTEYEVQVSFLKNGGLVLAETEFTRIPGEEVKTFRALDAQGNDLWTRPGHPDWVMAGEQLVVSEDHKLASLDLNTGNLHWQKEFSGPLRPVASDGQRLSVLHHNCRLMTLDADTGDITETRSTGDTILIGSHLSDEGKTLVSDHEGRFWKEDLPSPSEQVTGQIPESKLFHIPFLAGPIQRGEFDAVFVDWDGDETGTVNDPILLNREQETVTWSELENRAPNGTLRLENEQLKDLSLWFDSDQDGTVSSTSELSPLLENSSFDKARLDLAEHRLWLAADSTCS